MLTETDNCELHTHIHTKWHANVCVFLCVFNLWIELTPVDSYKLHSHYRGLALKDTPWLGVVVTLTRISKIIRRSKHSILEWVYMDWSYNYKKINACIYINLEKCPLVYVCVCVSVCVCMWDCTISFLFKSEQAFLHVDSVYSVAQVLAVNKCLFLRVCVCV